MFLAGRRGGASTKKRGEKSVFKLFVLGRADEKKIEFFRERGKKGSPKIAFICLAREPI
jgi:hypothetical protein